MGIERLRGVLRVCRLIEAHLSEAEARVVPARIARLEVGDFDSDPTIRQIVLPSPKRIANPNKFRER